MVTFCIFRTSMRDLRVSVGGAVYSPMISIVQQTHPALSDNGRKNIPKCGYTSLALLLTVLVHTSFAGIVALSVIVVDL